MSVSINFTEVSRMLEECAPGHTLRLATHSRVVHYNKKVFRGMPKHKEVEVGHIRKMVRYLEIDKDCVRQHLQNF